MFHLGLRKWPQTRCSASVLLVAVSINAAIRYAMNHPNEGIIFLEYAEPDEIISYISKYVQVLVTRLPKGAVHSLCQPL